MQRHYDVGRGPRIVAGPERLSVLAEWAGPHDGPVLLVADRGIEASGLLARARDALAGAGPVESFVAPPGEPTTTTVNAAAEAARALQGAAIVGIGGGTALDLAKLAAALASTQRPVEDFLLGAGRFPGHAPAAMVPTTAGTGAEATRTCIVSDPDGRKLWVWDPGLMPDLVVLDPALTLSLPPHLTVATGLDAFVHALEAATGGSRNRVNEAYALQAIRLVRDALPVAVATPDDLAGRQAMQEAALLAGLAIDTGGTGMAHTIGHALGSLYHIPHGLAVAVGLRASLAWSVAPEPPRYADAAQALGVAGGAEALADRLDLWLDELGLAAAIAAGGRDVVNATALAERMAAPENAPMAANNARVPQGDDLAGLAERTAALWNGSAGAARAG